MNPRPPPTHGPDAYLQRLVHEYEQYPESLSNYQLQEVARYFFQVKQQTENPATPLDAEAHMAATLIMDAIDWRLKRRETERERRTVDRQHTKPPEGEATWISGWCQSLSNWVCRLRQSLGLD